MQGARKKRGRECGKACASVKVRVREKREASRVSRTYYESVDKCECRSGGKSRGDSPQERRSRFVSKTKNKSVRISSAEMRLARRKILSRRQVNFEKKREGKNKSNNKSEGESGLKTLEQSRKL